MTASSRNLPQAVATALVLLGLMLGAMVSGPTAFFWLAAAVVSLAALELFIAVRGTGRRIVTLMGPAGALALMAAAYFRPQELGFLVVVGAVVVVLTFSITLRPDRGTTPATDVAWTVMGIFWIGGGGAGAVSMLTVRSGVSVLLAHVLITAADDIGAFFAGTAFGRHKMAPSISPAKSWEGVAGGFVAALAAGAMFGSIIDVIGVGHGIVIGAIIGFLAPAGDLAESLVKRELGIKDSGRMLPGHGGMLDRLDAILFGAPTVFLYLHFVVL